MKRQLARFRKAIVASIGAVAVTLTTALSDGAMSPADYAAAAVAVFTALGVYGIPNAPPANPVEERLGKVLDP